MNVVNNFIAFQLGWFACVLGAANGLPWVGPLVCLLAIATHLHTADRPVAELNLILSAVGIGIILDSLLVAGSLLSYPNGILLAGTAPYWILAMWALFACTLNVSMRWLRGKFALAALIGALGGPLSYLAGARLGAVVFNEPLAAATALVIGWGLAMPSLVWLARKFDGVGVSPKHLDPGHADA